MASVTFKRGTRAEIEATAKQDGQILMETDQTNNKMYVDLQNNNRVRIGNSNVDDISGITDSLTATSSNIALSAAGGNNLQRQIDTLNSNLNSVLHPSSIILLGSLKAGQNINIDLTQYTYILLIGVEVKIVPVSLLTLVNNFSFSLCRVASSSYYLYQYVDIDVTNSNIIYYSEYRSGWGDDLNIIKIYGVK